MSYMELRGNDVTKAPESPGLYAWYFRPVRHNRESILLTLSRLMASAPKVATSVTQRYGVNLHSASTADVLIGSDRQPIPDAIEKAFNEAEGFLEWFFESQEFVHFCRPIYIGIAKNLWDRVYTQHFTTLIDMWSPDSRVSKFVNANPAAPIQSVMDSLDLPHSFALEARTCCIAPRDLMVSVLATDRIPDSIGADTGDADEPSTRRALERLLQLLADPVCGRR